MRQNSGYILRRAVEKDSSHIRKLVREVGINPTSLDWHRFWLAVDEKDRLLGCGQVKPHADGSRELASIAVVPDRQKQGIATAIINQLLLENPPPLFLTCRPQLRPFYSQYNFTEASLDEMPAYFRHLKQLTRIIEFFKRGRQVIAIMVLHPGKDWLPRGGN
jgi:N-acetylglutamate synthase-like GNAT family acetyltransferase